MGFQRDYLAKASGTRGFTLIEMMIAVAVLAILSAIALPAYTDYVKRGKVSEAFQMLSSQGMAMEQFFQDKRTYDKTQLGSPCSTPPTGKYFNLVCTTTTATSYTLTATAATGSGVEGASYTLNEKAVRATTGVPAGWTNPGTTNCWVSSRSGSC